MCNRFRGIHDWSELPRQFYTGPRLNFAFNPNVAPTELVPIFVAEPDGSPRAVIARFGITMTGRDGKPRAPLLNVPTDGMRRGQLRTHLRERRCVIPAQGFYEWREEGGKQPYFFHRKDGALLMLACVWEVSEHKGDTRIAFAILTDEPNELIAAYHDRMPLVLADERVSVWLDLGNQDPLAETLLLELDAFAVRPMDRAMNSPRQKELAVIDPSAAA